jgi:hypothetical protein
MLNKILKLVIVAPVLMAGVFISANAEEKQVKPNIHNLTGEQSSKKVSSHKSSLGIGVGQTFLRSDLGNNGNDKITADVYYNYSASYSFDFLANLHYSTHQYINRSSKISGLALAIKGKGFQYDAFSPFVLGGFGFYMPGATRLVDGVLSTAREQLVFGFNAGVGADLRLNSNASIGVIAHYHDPFDVRQEVGPALQGSYLKLLMTAMYTFN